jgi:hypothetical protein
MRASLAVSLNILKIVRRAGLFENCSIEWWAIKFLKKPAVDLACRAGDNAAAWSKKYYDIYFVETNITEKGRN